MATKTKIDPYDVLGAGGVDADLLLGLKSHRLKLVWIDPKQVDDWSGVKVVHTPTGDMPAKIHFLVSDALQLLAGDHLSLSKIDDIESTLKAAIKKAAVLDDEHANVDLDFNLILPAGVTPSKDVTGVPPYPTELWEEDPTDEFPTDLAQFFKVMKAANYSLSMTFDPINKGYDVTITGADFLDPATPVGDYISHTQVFPLATLWSLGYDNLLNLYGGKGGEVFFSTAKEVLGNFTKNEFRRLGCLALRKRPLLLKAMGYQPTGSEDDLIKAANAACKTKSKASRETLLRQLLTRYEKDPSFHPDKLNGSHLTITIPAHSIEMSQVNPVDTVIAHLKKIGVWHKYIGCPLDIVEGSPPFLKMNSVYHQIASHAPTKGATTGTYSVPQESIFTDTIYPSQIVHDPMVAVEVEEDGPLDSPMDAATIELLNKVTDLTPPPGPVDPTAEVVIDTLPDYLPEELQGGSGSMKFEAVKDNLNLPPVPLKTANRLLQPTHGTSKGSVYHVVAISPQVRMSARYKGGELSMRLEGPLLDKYHGRISSTPLFVWKAAYASSHMTVTGLEADLAYGAALGFLGIEWDYHIPALATLRKIP